MERLKIIMLVMLVIFFTACSRDLGNYEYHEINEISITGLKTAYSVRSGIDVLHIEPNIAMTKAGGDPARFRYSWQVMKGTNIIDTIGRAAILDYKVTLSPDVYTLYLRVLDQETNVTWKASTSFTVGTAYSRGILLMGENEAGNAEADMIAMVIDTAIATGILSASGLPPLKGPITFQHAYGGLAAYVKVWVTTTSGGYYLDRQTLKGTTANTLSRLMYITDNVNKETLKPLVIAPQVNNLNGNTGNNSARAILTTDGDIFITYFALNSGDFYGNPSNRDKNNPGVLLKAAPYLMYPVGAMNSFMWYDIANQRFMNFSSMIAVQATPSVTLTDGGSDAFPWNQGATGRKLVYAENTRNTDGGSTNGNSFAIMKDNSNQCFIYKFYANGTTPAKRNLYTIKPLAVNFDKADFYAFSSKRSVVFYSIGNKLYAYDYNPNNEKFYEFPAVGTDAITMLKFDTQIDQATNSLYIGTYNSATKGTLTRYNVGADPNTVEITAVPKASWSGLVKIKDMNWRGVN
jgi:hypothetical protein